jgi:uncharacterized damage-inducible protein DinB
VFSKAMFQTLFAYHWHTNARMIAGAQKLDDAARKQKASAGRSIHELLYHLLRTNYAWRVGLETGRQPPSLREADYPDLQSLRAGFEREQAAWQALLDRLSTEEIEGDLQLTSYRGDQAAIPRWRILQHVVLHGMQHHADLAQLLTDRSQSPGDIDFIFFDPDAA